MARTDSGIKLIAKSAVLWLTVAAVFASIYGALLSTRTESRSLTFPASAPIPVVAVIDESSFAN